MSRLTVGNLDNGMTQRKQNRAVITRVGSGEDTGFAETASSVQIAADHDRGRFADVSHLRIDDPRDVLGAARARNLGLAQAADVGADWVFFLDAGQMMMPDGFGLVAPALDAYDAIWGSSCLLDADTGNTSLIRKTIPGFESFPILLNQLNESWIGMPHFVKRDRAQSVSFSEDKDIPSELAYVLGLWRGGRCIKTAQPFAAVRQPWQSLDAAGQAYMDRFVREHPVFIELTYLDRTVSLRYTGRNSILEGAQMRGQFFEQAALEYMAARLESGAVVIDVGANTGNHAVYFSLFCKASSVVLFEPNPEAISALTETIAANGLTNVDSSYLGFGLGAGSGRFAIDAPEGIALGSVSLTPDPAGEVEVKALDGLALPRADLIKIDVEDMELEVLAGAKETIRGTRPLLYVEVMDNNLAVFLQFVEELDYKIDKIFPELTLANYVLSPADAERQGEAPP